MVSILGQLVAEPAVAAEEGICAITAGTNSGQKFAALKCAKKSRPGYYLIWNTIWERDDKEAYLELAEFAGRSFACTLTEGRATRSFARRTISTHYEVSECR